MRQMTGQGYQSSRTDCLQQPTTETISKCQPFVTGERVNSDKADRHQLRHAIGAQPARTTEPANKSGNLWPRNLAEDHTKTCREDQSDTGDEREPSELRKPFAPRTPKGDCAIEREVDDEASEPSEAKGEHIEDAAVQAHDTIDSEADAEVR